MRATAKLDVAKPDKELEQSLANLNDDVLAKVQYGKTTLRRFKRGERVYGLREGNFGQIEFQGLHPTDYIIVEVLGPLTFSFED